MNKFLYTYNQSTYYSTVKMMLKLSLFSINRQIKKLHSWNSRRYWSKVRSVRQNLVFEILLVNITKVEFRKLWSSSSFYRNRLIFWINPSSIYLYISVEKAATFVRKMHFDVFKWTFLCFRNDEKCDGGTENHFFFQWKKNYIFRIRIMIIVIYELTR